MLTNTKEKKISDKKLQEKIGFYPHKNQELIINNPSREKVICAGRRFGKTMYAAYEVTKEILQPNKLVFILAPDYDLTKKVLDQVIINISKITNKYRITKKPIPTLTLPNGSRVESKSGVIRKECLALQQHSMLLMRRLFYLTTFGLDF